MNRITGRISHIMKNEPVQLVCCDAGQARLTAATLQLPVSLSPGAEVLLAFQETEVSLAIGTAPPLSLANCLQGSVQSLVTDSLFWLATVSTPAGPLQAFVPADWARTNNLTAGLAVSVVIRATDITLIAAGGPRWI